MAIQRLSQEGRDQRRAESLMESFSVNAVRLALDSPTGWLLPASCILVIASLSASDDVVASRTMSSPSDVPEIKHMIR